MYVIVYFDILNLITVSWFFYLLTQHPFSNVATDSILSNIFWQE